MDPEIQQSEILRRRISRRNAMKAGGIAAVGLAFSKPLIETIHPRAAFAQMSPMIDPTPTPNPTTPPIPTDCPITTIENIYAAMRLENLQKDKVSYICGDKPSFTYDIKNVSDCKVIVPQAPQSSFHLLGSRQHWVERLGPDKIIPAVPGNIFFDGTRYGSGGFSIAVDLAFPTFEMGPGAVLPLSLLFGSGSYDTTGFPAGDYRFHVEYRRADLSVIHTISIDLTLNCP